MRYIALEEAFFVPELTDLRPAHQRLMQLMRPEIGARYAARLADFTQYRLPEMDDAGIDIQVLSLTAPGLQIDLDAQQAREQARFGSCGPPWNPWACRSICTPAPRRPIAGGSSTAARNSTAQPGAGRPR
ncbi:hypothetical protein A5695_21825 [Mycobacterium sp. E1747]|nr:hypothetical protein [Mycobacterium sp. E1747]OBH10482.1 hypothetical protein A5695_21825 [Mycobacterium sp. E1747]